jgi:hypothetical protein
MVGSVGTVVAPILLLPVQANLLYALYLQRCPLLVGGFNIASRQAVVVGALAESMTLA